MRFVSANSSDKHHHGAERLPLNVPYRQSYSSQRALILDESPSYVYLREHRTATDLFHSLKDECKVRGDAEETGSIMQATLLWEREQERAALMKIQTG